MDTRSAAARLVPPVVPRDGRRLDRLLITDLVLDARIGVHAHEHAATQRVRINVEIQVHGEPAVVADDIANVLSYENIVAAIKDLIAAGHINLVETLAERIASICLADPRAERARVRVEKLDVEPDAAAVGIEIERPR